MDPQREPEKFDTRMLHLSLLSEGSPGVTCAWGESLAQAAAVCLETQDHSPGTSLVIDGDFLGAVLLSWDCVTEQMRKSLADIPEATEFGACGVAILLIESLTSLTVMERACKGTGFDYWLGTEGSTDNLFQGKKRLEVSGILQGDEASLRARVKKKLKQTSQSAGVLPAVVVVVEFSTPRSRLVEK